MALGETRVEAWEAVQGGRCETTPSMYEAAVRVTRGEWRLDEVIEWLRRVQRA